MNQMNKLIVVFFITFVFLTGCNTKAPEPTLDPNLIYTAAAQTAQSQLIISLIGTGTAVAKTDESKPTATQPATATAAPISQTDTPASASSTDVSRITPGATAATPGTNQTVTTAGTSTGIIILTPTQVATGDATGDKAKYIDQDPDDGSKVGENIGFNEIFKVKNVGTTTWTTTDYYVAQLNASDSLTEQSWYNLRKDVKPGDTAAIITDMHTPSKSGTFESRWCLINKANPTKCLSIFSVSIVVP